MTNPWRVLLLLAGILVLATPATAQPPSNIGTIAPTGRWTSNGRLLVGAPGNRLLLQAIRDGAGGAYLSWLDTRDLPTGEIYLTRIGADGLPAQGWPADGRRVRVSAGAVPTGWLCRGDKGGVYVVICDAGGATQAFIHHLADDGSALPGWPAEGTPVAMGGPISQLAPVQDGSGGLSLFAVRTPAGSHEGLVLRRWSAAGSELAPETILWSEDWAPGVELDGAVSDGAGRVYVTWRRVVSQWQMSTFGGYLDAYEGTTRLWQVALGVSPTARLIGDDLQGAFLFRGSMYSGYPASCLRLEPGGAVDLGTLPLFEPANILLAGADAQGGAIYTMGGLQAPVPSYDALRISPEATTVPASWWSGGLSLLSEEVAEVQPLFMQPDLRGGAFIGAMHQNGQEYSLLIQRIVDDGSFDPAWPVTGIPFRVAPGPATRATAMLDEQGGFLVFWLDPRDGHSNVYGQSFGPATTDVDPGPIARSLSLSLPRQPVRAGDRVRITLESAAPATLELFDVRGRSLWRESVRAGGAGSVEHALPAGFGRGVTWLRLTQGSSVTTAKLVSLP